MKITKGHIKLDTKKGALSRNKNNNRHNMLWESEDTDIWEMLDIEEE